MCGVAGIISKSDSIDVTSLNKFREGVMLSDHRGPDNSGEHIEGSVALFHQRLSIIDLDKRSHQPFSSRNQNLITVYNGEVYNFKDLAQKEGLELRTTSDTEVLVEMFAQKGLNAIPDWNGIFAFCAFDRAKGKIYLSRDRFGVKPLYYFQNEGHFLFASEAKVIYHWLPKLRICDQALAEFIAQGNSISGSTIVEGVKKVMPASIMELDIQTFQLKSSKYYHNPGSQQLKLDFKATVRKTRELLEASVERQLVADVPVGIFLSGGIDSSAVTAFASRNSSRKISTYSVEFDFNRGGTSELDNARMVAQKYNTNHHELKVESMDIIEIFEDLVFQHDEPFADAANIPLYLLSKAVRNDSTVVLQGDGGDELFAGYGRYELLSDLKKWRLLTLGAQYLTPSSIGRKRAKRISNALNSKDDYMKLALLTTSFKFSDYDLFADPIAQRLKAADPFAYYQEVEKKFQQEPLVQKMLYSDLEIELPNTYLEKVDKSTMLNSIEARVPFLDNDLVSFVCGLPSSYKVHKGQKKYLLREALRGVVPNEILDAPKRGFGVPKEIWLRETMADYAKEKLSSKIGCEILNSRRVNALLEEHQSFKADHSHVIWKLLVLVIWFEKFQDKLSF